MLRKFILFSLGWALCLVASQSVDVDVPPIEYIIGGNPVAKGSYPYFALALRPDGRFFCGGTLISPEFVLTAAHCALGPFPMVKFLLGALCLAMSDNCGQYSEYMDVHAIFSHPQYNSTTMENDFAVVQLKSKSPILPVNLDTGMFSPNYTIGKQNLYAAGFGRISTSNPYLYPNHLMEVELAYTSQDTCNTDYGGSIFPSMMCATDPGQDACYGDSGGPLIDFENNVQVGIVSWGNGCANTGYPGVYARISNQWLWIRDTICEHSIIKPDFCPSSSPSSSQPSESPTVNPSSVPTMHPTVTSTNRPIKKWSTGKSNRSKLKNKKVPI